MRGGSIIGAVLLIALLSAAATVLDGASLATGFEKESQVAAVGDCGSSFFAGWSRESSCETVSGKGVRKGISIPSPDYDKLTCQVGNDFILRVNSDGSDGKIYYADGSGHPTAWEMSQCPSPATPESFAGNPRRQCTDSGKSPWKCYIRVCFRSGQKNTDESGVGCGPIRTDKPFKVGDKIGGGDVVKQSTQQGGRDVKDLMRARETATTDQEKAQIDAQLQTLNEQTSGGVLSAFEQDIKTQEEAIAQTEADYQKKDQEFWTCMQGQPVVNAGACADKQAAVTAAQLDRDAKQRKLEEMREYAQSLGKDSATLCPPGGPPCSTTTTRPPNGTAGETGGDAESENSSIAGAGGKKDDPPGNPGGCAGSTFGCGGNGPGQQIVIGSGYGGAHPSGGGYPGGAQPCGAQQQQQQGGGLIGVVISLFTKSNTSGSQNCQNGVPVPSCTITASPTNVAAGQPVTLTWQSQQAFSANLSTSGSVAPQGSMTVNPQTTTSYVLQLSGYMDNRTGQQLRGQCVVQVTVDGQGGGDGAPKAEISCRPERADVGMSVALSFACRNSASSGGTGFSTNNQMSGSATPVVESPTLGSSVAKYALTCSKEGKTDTAECTVKINTTSIVLIANPKKVKSGGEANIGWITSGMESCAISSPTLSGFTAENAGNTSTSGVAKTPNLTGDATFVLSCTTKAGGTKTAETTVTVD